MRIASTYQGRTSISVGTISVLKITMKMMVFNGNSNLARVYPASESNTATLAVVINAMMKLFRNQRR